MDVVTTVGQQWTRPPFEALEQDGFIWGRGAVDMKGGVAMMLAALLRARAEGIEPAGDVIFCALADEENMSPYGAEWLVREHRELFDGVRHAIGEFGGFTMHVGGQRFYPIQVAEKQVCTMRMTLRGAPRTRLDARARRRDGKDGARAAASWTGGACRCTSRRSPARWWRAWRAPCRGRRGRFCACC